MSAAATTDALEELEAMGIHMLTPREQEEGWVVIAAAIIDRWSSGRGSEHIVIGSEVRAPDNWTQKRAGVVFRSSSLRKPFFLWLRSEEAARRVAEALLAASRM